MTITSKRILIFKTSNEQHAFSLITRVCRCAIVCSVCYTIQIQFDATSLLLVLFSSFNILSTFSLLRSKDQEESKRKRGDQRARTCLEAPSSRLAHASSSRADVQT